MCKACGFGVSKCAKPVRSELKQPAEEGSSARKKDASKPGVGHVPDPLRAQKL